MMAPDGCIWRPLQLVAFYCGLTVRLVLACELKREPVPAGRRSLSYRWRLDETKAAATDQHGCPLCACRANFTTHEAVKAPRPRSGARPARP